MDDTTLNHVIKKDQDPRWAHHPFAILNDEGNSRFTGQTVEQLIAEHGDVFELLTEHQYVTTILEPHYKNSETEFHEITEQEFMRLMEELFPQRWNNGMFMFPETIDGPLHIFCLKRHHKYFKATKDARKSNSEISEEFDVWYASNSNTITKLLTS